MHPLLVANKRMRSHERATTWVWAWVAWTGVAVLLASSGYASRLAVGEEGSFGAQLARAVLGTYPWIPITVAVFALTRRFPLDGPNRLQAATVHLGAGVPMVVGQVAFFHHVGQALGLLRPEPTLLWALLAFAGHRAVTYALLLGVAHASEYRRRAREREIARVRLEAQLVQAQLQTLKMQLHPHFLFNTLNAVSALVPGDPLRAQAMIGHLSDLLRGTLARQGTQEVALRDELAALEPYLEIERARFGSRLRVDVSIRADTFGARVPHLLLQPLVENAIRHGIAPRRGPGQVEIATRRSDGRLRLEVRDSGNGITGPPRSGAVGLTNIRARLERLYGADHDFRIDSAPGAGTRVRITIPFRPAPEDSTADGRK